MKNQARRVFASRLLGYLDAPTPTHADGYRYRGKYYK